MVVKRLGQFTVQLSRPCIVGAYTLMGPREGEGPLGNTLMRSSTTTCGANIRRKKRSASIWRPQPGGRWAKLA